MADAKKPAAALFVDGSNFYHALKSMNLLPFGGEEFRRLFDKLTEDHNLKRIFFYDAIKNSRNEHAGYSAQQRFQAARHSVARRRTAGKIGFEPGYTPKASFLNAVPRPANRPLGRQQPPIPAPNSSICNRQSFNFVRLGSEPEDHLSSSPMKCSPGSFFSGPVAVPGSQAGTS